MSLACAEAGADVTFTVGEASLGDLERAVQIALNRLGQGTMSVEVEPTSINSADS